MLLMKTKKLELENFKEASKKFSKKDRNGFYEIEEAYDEMNSTIVN